jgi:DNA-binding transcriptional LysR family regulator
VSSRRKPGSSEFSILDTGLRRSDDHKSFSASCWYGYLTAMELRQLILFCLITEQRSISKAAKTMSLSQPTVSQHLKALEAQLGTRLFHRMGRQTLPTHAGEAFYPYVKRALELIGEAKTAVAEHTGKVKGDLWIAGSTIPGHYILPGMIGPFHQRYPAVKIHLRIGDSEWVVDRVVSREVELGFVGARVERPGLTFEPFAKDELILVVSQGHPLAGSTSLSFVELASTPLLSREQGSGTRASWEALMVQSGIDPKDLQIAAELGSTEAVVRGVRSGMGAGIVSLRAVEEEITRGTLVRIPLEGPRLERTFYLVQHVGRALSLTARTFAEFVCGSSPASNCGHNTGH